MSSDQDFQFNRVLSLSEIIGLSFKIYFSNKFVWVFYLLTFLLGTLFLFIISDLGIPTVVDSDFNELLVSLNELISSTDFTDPNANTSEIFNLTNRMLFIFSVEWLIMGIFLSVPYALTIFFVKSNLERILPNHLLNKVELNIHNDVKPLSENLKISFSKMIPKLIPIVIAAFLLNFLTVLGFNLFFLPGIIISGLFCLVPVVLLSESEITVGKSFKRSYNLVKGYLFKTIIVLLLIGLIQYILDSIIQLLLVNIYVVISGIDPDQIDSITDPILIAFRFVSRSFFAPLSIISLILMYYDLKIRNQQKYSQPWNFQIQNQPIQPYSQPPPYKQTQITNIVPPNEERIFCISCGKPNPIYGSFCAFCGIKLLKPSESSSNIETTNEKSDLDKNMCKNCGKPPKKPEDKFCAYCGVKYGIQD